MDTNTTATQELTMDTITNTSAVATIDGDELATLHGSAMADVLASYSRSAALVVDRSDLYALARCIRGEGTMDDRNSLTQVLAAIEQGQELGLR